VVESTSIPARSSEPGAILSRVSIPRRSYQLSAAPRGPLIVRLCNWVGEVVLSVPALRRLADAGYDLHLFGKAWAPALLEGSGWPVLARPPGLGAATRALRVLKAELAVRAPPALLMTKSLSSAIEARLAGLRACGYAHDGRSLLLSAAYPMARFEHASQGYWHLAGRFLNMDAPCPPEFEIHSSPAQEARAVELIEEHGLVRGRYVMFCPFSGADDRRRRKVWPGFGALAGALAAAGVAVVVCPGAGEEAVATATLPTAVRMNGIDLGVYGALQRLARVVVANDTGPGHLAAAVGARLVSIYGPHSVAAWAPCGRNVRLFHEAAGWPTVEWVAAAVLA
jgi:heptosyltransferase-2